jgi:hypothetical protein
VKNYRRLLVGLVLATFGGIAALLAFNGGSAGALTTCNANWNVAASGNWSDPTKWDTATVPTSAQTVCINKAGTYTVTVDTTIAEAKSIRVGDTTSTGVQTLQIGAAGVPGYLQVNGATADPASSIVTGGAATNGKITVVNGTMNIAGGQVFTESGTGTINVAAGQTFLVSPGNTFKWTAGTNTGDPVTLYGGAADFSTAGTRSGTVRHVAGTTVTSSIPAGVTLELLGSCTYGGSVLNLTAVTTTNNGTITMTDDGCNYSSVIQSDNSGVTRTLSNAATGIINMNVGSGGAYRDISASLDNLVSGTINVNGNARLYPIPNGAPGPGLDKNRGNINVAAAGVLDVLNYGQNFEQVSGTIANLGAVILSTPTVKVSGGTMTGNPIVANNTNLDVTAGTGTLLTRGTANHFLNATVPTNITLLVQASCTYGYAYLYMDQNLTNNGVVTITDDGANCGYTSGVYTNGDVDPSFTFTNNGTLNASKVTGGRRDLQATLINNASKTVNVGSDDFVQYGRSVNLTNSGAFNVLAGGKFSLNTYAGPRAVTFAAGTVTNGGEMVFNGDGPLTSTMSFAGGTFTNTGSLSVSSQALTITAGAITGNRVTAYATDVNVSGATAAYPGFTFRQSNTFLGNVPAATTIVVQGSPCVYGSAYLYLKGNVTNNGTVTLTDDGSTPCGASTVGLYSDTSPDPSYTLTNNGTLNVFKGTSGGARQLQISLVNNATRTVDVTSDDAQQYGGSIVLTNNGTFKVQTGAKYSLTGSSTTRTVTFGGGTVTNDGEMSFPGDGVLTSVMSFTGGTFTNNSVLAISSYAVNFTAGALTGNRPTMYATTIDVSASTAAFPGFLLRQGNHYKGNIPAANTVTVEGSPCVYGGATLWIDSNMTNNGTLTLTDDGGTGCGGAAVGIFSDDDPAPDPSFILTNNGTLNILQGTAGGGRRMDVGLVNNASKTVNITSDNLATYGYTYTVTNNGTISVAAGALWAINQYSGPLNVNQSNGTFTNLGTVGITGATFNFSGGTTTGNPIRLSGSTLQLNTANAGAFALIGTSTLTDSSPASVTVSASQRLDLVDACNQPVVTVSPGFTGNLTNAGLIQLINESCGYNGQIHLGADTGTFSNNGTLRVVDDLTAAGGSFGIYGSLNVGATGNVEILDENVLMSVLLASPDFPGGALNDGSWILRGAVQYPGLAAIQTIGPVASVDLGLNGEIYDSNTATPRFSTNLKNVNGTLKLRGTYALAAGTPFTAAGHVYLYDDSRLNAAGTVSLPATSILDVEVTSATAFGRIAAVGAVTINSTATLNMTTDIGYSPAVGANHDVITGSSIVGTYTFPSNVHGWDIGVNAKAYQVQYPPAGTPTAVRLATVQRTLTVGKPAATVAEAATPAAFTMTLSIAPEVTASVSASTFVPSGASVHAVPGEDYTAISGQLVTWGAGETVKSVNVTLNNDVIDEYDEDLGVIAASPTTNVVIGTASDTRAIVDDDAAPVASITLDAPLIEGPGIHNATYTVTLTGRSEKNVLVNYATANGGANAPRDFTAISGQLTLPKLPSSTEVVSSMPAAITVQYSNHTRYSNVPATFNVNLTAADVTVTPHGTNGVITSTIPNTTAPPSIAITGGRRFTEATTSVGFPLFLTAPADVSITVSFATANGTATAGSDYTATSGTVTFLAGETSKSIPVAILGDAVFENDETFTLTLTSPSPAAVTLLSGSDVAVGTIANDDAAPVLSVSGPSPVAETATARIYTVTKTGATELPSTVAVNLVPGTAGVPSDVTGAGTTLSFLAADTTKTFTATVVADTLDEVNETFTVEISSPSGATIGTATKLVTITDDDATPSLAPSDRSVAESAGTVTIPVTLSAVSGQTVTVQFATANGTGVAGTDYTSASGSLTFNPGVTEQSVTVPVLNNSADQPDRTFVVNFTSPSNATVSPASATVTVVDDDATPSLSIAGPSPVTEGNAGTTNAGFTVTLSAASLQSVTVQVATADGTATSADYNAVSTTLTFAPGETSKPVTPTVIGDVLDEVDETFTATLTSPANAVVGTASATATIVDDDALASLSVSGPATVAESIGTAGYTITLTPASAKTVTVSATVVAGTANVSADVAGGPLPITFAPGETSKPFNATVVNDTVSEATETFSVQLSSPANATLGTGSVGTSITDDDALPALSVGDVTVLEGTGAGSTVAVVPFNLSGASGSTVTFAYATASGTATSGTDFTSTSGTVTFTPGQTLQTVSVPITRDSTDEVDETFTVGATTPVNATISDGSGLATINDDDASPTVSIGDATNVTETAGGVTQTFVVTLSQASSLPIQVTAATAAGTAASPGDYVAIAGSTVSFGAGVTTQNVTVTVNDDVLDEANETYEVVLSAPSNVTIADGRGSGTIVDDDAAPTVSIADPAAVNEVNPSMTFTATLSAVSGQTVQVSYQTEGVAARSGADFTGQAGVLTFTPGQTTRTVVVGLIDDVVDENPETFEVRLDSPVAVTINDGVAVGQINDNDATPKFSVADAQVLEGNSGTTTMQFTVTLAAAAERSLSVTYSTGDGTATTANSDYTAVTNRTLSFAAGETSKVIFITVKGNTVVETNETFFLNLLQPAGNIDDGQAVGTILNDD